MFKEKRGLLTVILFSFFVFANIGFVSSVEWNDGVQPFYGNEEISYSYNVSENVTNVTGDLSIIFDTDNGVVWDNGTDNVTYSSLSPLGWISYNSNTFILSLNSGRDNESGEFDIHFQPSDEGPEEPVRGLYFTINATNDAPEFTLDSSYNTTALVMGNSSYSVNLSGTDEEEHYPLNYSIKSFNSCSVASWSTRNDSEGECSLNYTINPLSGSENTTSVLNFTNITKNDVGSYDFTVCSNDSVTDYNSPEYSEPGYNSSEEQTCYNTTLNIYYSLGLNVSNCSSLSGLNESGTLSCLLSVTTKYSQGRFNISSNSFINNGDNSYISDFFGRDWFYKEKTSNSSNHQNNSIQINIPLNKSHVGNWTINLTLDSLDTSEDSITSSITFFVNRTTNSSPVVDLTLPSENTTSINALTKINISAEDNDFLISDKNLFNESIFFNITLYNKTNSSDVREWQEFQDRNLTYMSGNGNLSFSTISFEPNESQIGNWTINFSYLDNFGNSGYDSFDLEILNNTAPYWTKDVFRINLTVNSSLETTESFFANLTNLSGDYWANDSDGDNLTFKQISFLHGKPDLSTGDGDSIVGGEINFTPWKDEVSIFQGEGVWNTTVRVSDGYLKKNSTWIFNITNVNSPPVIQNLSYSDTYYEDSSSIITFNVSDPDLVIPSYDTDAFPISVNLTNTSVVQEILGLTGEDFLLVNISTKSEGYLQYQANFTPNNLNDGNYTITINVTDSEGESNQTSFNFIIEDVNDAPQFNFPSGEENMSNQTYSIEDIVDINLSATDEELGNLTYNYTLLPEGKQEDVFRDGFNTDTGLFNVTLNESDAGKYYLNYTVTDENITEGGERNNVSIQFWIFVYDSPNITFPSEGMIYNLNENQTFEFNLTGNHTIQDNLTYEFWIDSMSCSYNDSTNCSYQNLTSRENMTSFGNNSNVFWNYSLGFNEETYGNLKNLTIIAYPSNTDLQNKKNLNTTRNVNLNITHINHPVNFSSNIGSSSASYGQTIPLQLENYFTDLDAFDNYYNQSVIFTLKNNTNINGTFSGWNLVLSAKLETPLEEELWILAEEINSSNSSDVLSNASSNNFNVSFTEPIVVSDPQDNGGGGGGGTTTQTLSLKIEVPDTITVNETGQIEVPISLINDGDKRFSNVELSNIVKKEGFKMDKNASFSKSSFSSISKGETKNLSVMFSITDFEPNLYEIKITSTAGSPTYSNSNSVFLNFIGNEATKVKDTIVFAEGMINENPKCLELSDMVEDAKARLNEGSLDEALERAQLALETCKSTISSKKIPKREVTTQEKVLIYLAIAFAIAVLSGGLFNFYKWWKFKRKRRID